MIVLYDYQNNFSLNDTLKGGMNMCNFYSYMRISTEEERGLQKFTRQENALQRYAKENSIEYLLEFKCVKMQMLSILFYRRIDYEKTNQK